MDSYTKQINAWKTVWQKNKKPRFINGTVWEQLIGHWEKEETAETSSRNSRNRKSDRGGKGMYVHNLGACSMSTKEDELVSFLLLFIFIFLNNYFIYSLANNGGFFRSKQMTVIPLIVSNSLRWLTLTRRRVKFRTP